MQNFNYKDMELISDDFTILNELSNHAILVGGISVDCAYISILLLLTA